MKKKQSLSALILSFPLVNMISLGHSCAQSSLLRILWIRTHYSFLPTDSLLL